MSAVPTRIKRHWQNVVDLNCLLTGSNQVQLCHCHGISLLERNPRFLKGKGKKQIWQHWLVIPLREDLHRIMDYDPDRFTDMYDTPAALLDQVCVLTGVNVWERALAEMKPVPEGVPV